MRRARPLIVANIVAVAVLGGVVGWLDRSIHLKPGSEPMSQPTAQVPFSVRLHPYEVQILDSDELPYAYESAAPIVSELPTDASGVRMFMTEGHLVDHPVGQAQYALALLDGYRLTGDPERLELARRQADRLLNRALPQGDAIYLPYPFDFRRHNRADDVMRAPWFSAMAQGQALSVFVRLVEITGDKAYQDAADRTFASFLSPGDPPKDDGSIWTVFIDAHGYYWPEEYAATTPDRTFNGAMFAAYGIYDYYRLTDSRSAELLFQATLTTVHHALDGIRVPGGVSYYCLQHAVQSETYHEFHVGELHMLHRLTGDQSFAEWGDLLRQDHDLSDTDPS